jgi:hypothetical protein
VSVPTIARVTSVAARVAHTPDCRAGPLSLVWHVSVDDHEEWLIWYADGANWLVSGEEISKVSLSVKK